MVAVYLQMYSFDTEIQGPGPAINGTYSMTTHSWSRRKTILYSTLIVLALLLCIELVFRILFYVQYNAYGTSVQVQGNTLQQEDSLLVFRNRPLYLDYTLRFQHNREGMRSEPGRIEMPVKQEGDYWVFLFGASAIEGMGSNKDGEWLDITGRPDYPWNESIAFYLEENLQKALPGKKVKVFNAANSSFTLEQSYLRYLELSKRYAMDFVVSLDGQNNPEQLGANETVMDWVRRDWSKRPVQYFPLNFIVPLTRNSAAAHTLKQWSFQRRMDQRLQKNEEDKFPRRSYWAGLDWGQLQQSEFTDSIRRSVGAYYQQLYVYDSTLTARRQPHLLLLQPHLVFRDHDKMKMTEKALWNYYCAAFNTAARNRFLQELRTGLLQRYTDSSRTVQLFSAPDTLSAPVFTDYCHFTPEANRFIAQWLSEQILRQKPE